MRSPNFHHYSADAHDISAQIDLIGMPRLIIREDPVSRAERRISSPPAGRRQLMGRPDRGEDRGHAAADEQ
jgi:hypothetical protein